MSHEPKRPVTIEDLLRLKRAERPPAEFWERFDRELRAKQLAALVKQRPWWQTMPRVFSTWRRYHLPLGATAVLALTFISLREYSSLASRLGSVSTQLAGTSRTTGTADDAANSGSGVVLDAHLATALQDSESSVKDSTPRSAESTAGSSTDFIANSGAALPENTFAAEVVYSPRSMMANFTAGHPSGPVGERGWLSGAMVDSRPLTLRGATVEPLAQMTPPGEVRRARILSAVTLAAAGDTLTRTGERVARNLSDERMNDSIRRFNAKADRLSMKW